MMIKQKIKTQRGAVKIPLLATIIVSIIAIGGIGYGIIKHQNRVSDSNIAEKVEQPVKEERHNGAIEIENRAVREAREKAEKEVSKKITEEAVRRAVEAEIQLGIERQMNHKEITELRHKKQEVEGWWIEADTKRAIGELLRVGSLLVEYYGTVREGRGVGQNWWRYKYLYEHQEEVDFAAQLALHGIGALYWSELEPYYYYHTGRHSTDDAVKILDNILFTPFAVGIDYDDSDFEKIQKILNFFHYHIRYDYDFNQKLNAPAETIGLRSGDCDDWSILISAALARVGINSAIVFVVNEDGTYAHAMVLIQSGEILPFWYYQDLTDFGLPSGEWSIIEPQFTLEQHQERPEWFDKWWIVAAALVGNPY